MVKIVVLFIALAYTTTSQAQCGNGNSGQGLIQRAVHAAQDCLPANIQNLEISGNIETVSGCYYYGSITRVTIYTSPRCVHQPCPMFPSRLVAIVEFGCDGQVVSVTCK